MPELNLGATIPALEGYGPTGELLSLNDERREYKAAEVRLKFAESYFGAAGGRILHVDSYGMRVLTNFDVYAAAGGPKQSVDREFPVTVTNGHVQILLTAVASSATVSGIEIVGASGSGFTPVRVNCGGGAVTDARGVVWSADYGYSGGAPWNTASTVNGEVVNYSYDALGRIAAAQIGGSAGWGFSYAFDGWGNRTEQRQTKTGLSSTILSYAAASNRITSAGYGYDANGNMTQINAPVAMTLTYDQENRLVTTSAGEQYGYAPDNKRVWKSAGGSEWLYFWLGDRMLTRYSVASGTYALNVDRVEKYFGGRVIGTQPDRLGSDVAGGKRYYPYGEEVAPSGNEAWKFGTYWREGNGLDYADQRWYASGVGRFLTADPYGGSAYGIDPGSWNRYDYASGDVPNLNDTDGLIQCGDLRVIGGLTVRDYLGGSDDSGKLARFVWAEGGTLLASGGDQRALQISMAFIAQAIDNRLDIANGRVAVAGVDGNIYWGNGGVFNGVTTMRASILGFGGVGTTLTEELVRAAAGTGELDSAGELVDRSGLDRSLNVELGDPTRSLPGRVAVTLVNGDVDFVTPECYRVIAAMQGTYTILLGDSFNIQGRFVTSWKQAGHGNTNPDRQRLGGMGIVGGTTFYGFGAYEYIQYPYHYQPLSNRSAPRNRREDGARVNPIPIGRNY